MGRPPAAWMFKLLELKLENQWTDAYEISDCFKLTVSTVKKFLIKLELEKKHEVINGKAHTKYKLTDIKKATKSYLEPWLKQL